LHAHHFALQGPDHLEEREALAREALALGRLERSFALRESLAADHLIRGDIKACRTELAAAAATAESSRHPAFAWLCTADRASLALLEGHLDEAEELAREALWLGRRIDNPNAGPCFLGHAFLLARERGRIEDLVATVAAQGAGFEWSGTFARVGFAALFAELGRADDARAAFRALAAEGFRSLQRRDEWLASVVELAKLCADVGEREHAPVLEELLAPYLGLHAVYPGPLFYLGPVSRALGHLAAAQGRAAEARALLERAGDEAQAVEAAPWTARIERELAALGRAERVST
jgi:hypothetical protein